MENYILKLNSGTEYKLYEGTTLVSDADLTTLFGTAGEMYLSFDFNSGTPSSLTTFTITDSSDNAVITNANVTVAEGKNYKATWSASATTFDTFEELAGKALDESQLSFLMEKIKGAKEIKELSITADIKAKDLFGDNDTVKDGDIYLVKNTANDTRKISFTNNVSDTDITHYVMLGAHASVLFIFEQSGVGNLAFTAISSRTGFGGPGYNSAQYNNTIMKSGLWDPSYGYVNNPQIAGLQLAAVDNLTTTATMNPLSANQGRVLNTRIGNLSTLTTTVKTSAVAAINEVNAKGVYSTSEQVIGTWINGKPLYRKIIDFGSLPNNTLKYVSIVDGARVEVVDCRASIHTDPNSSFSSYAPTIPLYHPDNGHSIRLSFSEYQIGIASNYDASDFSANVFVYYWKATD